MNVEVPGVPLGFNELTVGSFFMFERSRREYGICVSDDGQRKAAVILSTTDGGRLGRLPWLAVGGLPQDAVVFFPSAVLRASQLDITADLGQLGTLITAGDAFYISVSDTMGGYRTFNVATGQLEALPQGRIASGYSRWRVGIMVDDNFETIFSFPPEGDTYS
jgi:hypothetical protein